MRKDPTEFRKRFAAWKDGKLPYKAGLPKYEDGKYVQAGKDNSWSRISDNDVSDTFQEIIARPSHRGGNTTVGNWNRQWSLKGEPGLEIVSPEFDLLALLSPVRINPISYRQYKAERQISNSFNKGIKENSILNSYNSVPSNKDIGTTYEYLDFLDNIFPNSKLNQVFYHGGPKGISKFKSAKQLGSTNKNIISGTKDYGIYFADDLDLAKYYRSSHKKDGLIYTVRVNVEKPIEYNTNNWYLDKFKGTQDLRFSPGTVTEKWYNKLNLKNYDGIYHRHSTNAFDNGELVMFDPDNIHIMGTPLETNMFYKWKLNPIYSKKQLEQIPIMPTQYDKTLKNYMKAIEPGAVIGSLLGAPVGLTFYEIFKHKLKNNNIKVNDDQNSFRNDSIDRSLY